jgi:hypothetical protein
VEENYSLLIQYMLFGVLRIHKQANLYWVTDSPGIENFSHTHVVTNLLVKARMWSLLS